MSSTEIKKQIDTLQDELSELKNREKSLAKELEKTTDDLTSNFDDSEARTKIRSFKTDKDILSEVIERKQTTLSKLEEMHNAVIAEEQYQALIDLAKKAEQMEEGYREKIEEINAFLEKEIPELLKIKRQWRKTAEDFMKSADNHSPGFLEATSLSYGRQNKRKELQAEQLMKTLKDEGVDFSSAMSHAVLRSRYYAMPLKPIKSFKGLAFSEAIQSMCNQRNVPTLMEERG